MVCTAHPAAGARAQRGPSRLFLSESRGSTLLPLVCDTLGRKTPEVRCPSHHTRGRDSMTRLAGADPEHRAEAEFHVKSPSLPSRAQYERGRSPRSPHSGGRGHLQNHLNSRARGGLPC